MRSVDDIVSLYHDRLLERVGAHRAMDEISEVVNGRMKLPTDEADEDSVPMVANLINQGAEQVSMRIASTLPDLTIPATNPASDASMKRAANARRAALGWWDANKLPLLMRKRARQLLVYAESPVVILPNWRTRMPKWDIRDPRSAYPPPMMGVDPIVPNCIFTYRQTYQWLAANHPVAAAQLPLTARMADAEILLLEYFDDDDRVLVALGEGRVAENPSPLYQGPGRTAAFPGPGSGNYYRYGTPAITNKSWLLAAQGMKIEYVEIGRFSHLLGMSPVVYPTRISLDEPQGHFQQLIALYRAQAELMALSKLATERGVFSEIWFESNQPGVTPVPTQLADARAGIPGILKDGRVVPVQVNPGFMTNPTIDRLEAAMRATGSLPPDLGGESGTNIRTGRRGQNVMASAIDFPIQEQQDILGYSLAAETAIGITLTKRWWGSTSVSYYVNWKGARGKVDYTPNRVFDSEEVHVSYAASGADVNQLNIQIGQLLGLKLLSRETARKKHPMVDDPEFEHDSTTAEGLEDALLASIQNQATQGAIPPSDLARIMELVRSNKMELPQAVMQAQKEAQERQATQAPPGTPETQPGLALPGAGAEQPAQIPPPAPSMQNFTQLLGSLRLPQRAGRAERGLPIMGGNQ